MKVVIYHNESDHRFWDWHPGDKMVRAYEYEANTGDFPFSLDYLEDIWRDNNAVEGWEYPVKFQTRSLSVADMVKVAGHYFVVLGVGWKEVSKWSILRARFVGIWNTITARLFSRS